MVGQAEGERGFHAFAFLLAGLPEPLRAKFGLTSAASKYFYLNQVIPQMIPELVMSLILGPCQGKSAMPEAEGAAGFAALEGALERLGVTADSRHGIFRLLAAILHLGNLYFNRKPQGVHHLPSRPTGSAQMELSEGGRGDWE